MSCGILTTGPTFSCGCQIAGPTEVSLSSVVAKWLAPPSHMGADGWPHGGFPRPTQSIVPYVVAKWLAPLYPVGTDGCPHRGSHPHQFIVLFTPTYLLSSVLTPASSFMFVLVGGLVFEPLPPHPPLPPLLCPSLPPPRPPSPPPNIVSF